MDYLKKHLKKKILSGVLALSLVLPFANINKVEAAVQDDVIKIAETQLGVPYRFGGTTPSGFDCSGFVRYVFDKVDVNLPRTTGEQYQLGEKISKKDLKPGDIVFFANTYKRGISHSGIYIGNNKFISATSSKGIAIVSLNNSYWGPKFVAGKRILKEEVKPNLPAGEFYDVPKNSEAFEAISALGTDGIINGYDASLFKPDQPVTRGQAAAMLNRQLNLQATNATSFSDVSNTMAFATDIAAIEEAGIIQGFDDGTFRPKELLTRAQLAVIMDRAYELDTAVTIASAKAAYQDLETDYWAYDSIIALSAVDTTNVFHHSDFRARESASRADFAAAMYSAMKVK